MDVIVSARPNRGGEGAPLFTCNTCGLTFPTADLQRLHMKTDWHRYNLKRKVASLPPISSELFAEKMVQQQQAQQAEAENTGRSRGSGHRQITKKDRKKEERLLRKIAMNKSENNNVGQSIERPSSPASSMVSSTFSLGEPIDESYAASVSDDLDDAQDMILEENMIEEIDEEEREIQRKLETAVHFGSTTCFVDGTEFATVEENVDYMSKKYGLFIPEKDYLTDMVGLIEYLGEKVGMGNMCLYCSFQGRTLESIRAHMLSKRHVKIPYEKLDDKLEISEFYDFTSSYDKMDSRSSGNEEEWEDVSDAASDEETDESDEVDEAEDGLYVDGTGYELSLASGQRIGHRSLARYYKQNLRPTSLREGQGTVMAVDSRNLVALRDRIQDKQVKQAWKDEKKHKNIHIRRDKFINNQPHFRDTLLQ